MTPPSVPRGEGFEAGDYFPDYIYIYILIYYHFGIGGWAVARSPPFPPRVPEGRTCGMQAARTLLGIPGARAVAAVFWGYFVPITCAIVNRPHPGLQPSVPREALNTGRGLFGEVLQHIINSIIFNNH